MRHKNQRDSHQRHRGRSTDRQPRSRDQHQFRDRDREPIDRPDWRKDNYRAPHPSTKVQDRDRNNVEPIVKVNRKETCPFLVRVFYSINKENVFDSNVSLPDTWLPFHLWMDCSLREIGELLRAHLPTIRTKQRFQFWRVYNDEEKGGFARVQMGSVLMHRRSDRLQDRSLGAGKFRIGDMIDVSIYYK